MKNLIFCVVFGFLAGCGGVSTSVLNLSPYQVSGKFSSNADITINSIRDTRQSTSNIATITDSSGTVKEYIVLQDSLETWFNDALLRELKQSGARVNQGGETIVDVEITELKANLSGYAKDNLKGTGSVVVKIDNGEKVTTKRISQPQTQFAPIPTAGAFSPFVKDLLDDIVKSTAKAILAN